MKKIYSKFVKDRKKEFQIETSIWDDNGRKFIRKKNLYEEGKNHISQIYETYKMYENRNILCEVSMENNAVMFCFLSGDTFEQKLIDAIKSEDKTKVEQAVGEYQKIVSLVCREEDKKEILNETGYVKVFGEETTKGKMGFINAIFDLTFDNLIQDGDGYKVIDYEWRFPFAIDKEFIVFRAVYAFLMKYSSMVEKLYTKEEFYRIFNIDNGKNAEYIKLNNLFIDYVYGKEGYNKVLQKYKKLTMNVLDERVMQSMRILATEHLEKESVEDKVFAVLLDNIRAHQDIYDDYKKFFQVTEKLKSERTVGYLISREFSEEFSAYIAGFYNMLEYYKKESETREKMMAELAIELETKEKENIELQNKYSTDYDILSGRIRELESRLQYIESCKVYKMFLEKKVEERFG